MTQATEYRAQVIRPEDNPLIMDVENSAGRRFRVLLDAARRDRWDALVGLVEFWDLTHMHTPNGQFTGGRYYVTSLLDGQFGDPLCLDGGIPVWTIDGPTMRVVREWVDRMSEPYRK